MTGEHCWFPAPSVRFNIAPQRPFFKSLARQQPVRPKTGKHDKVCRQKNKIEIFRYGVKRRIEQASALTDRYGEILGPGDSVWRQILLRSIARVFLASHFPNLRELSLSRFTTKFGCAHWHLGPEYSHPTRQRFGGIRHPYHRVGAEMTISQRYEHPE
jgi:hypothetical protein